MTDGTGDNQELNGKTEGTDYIVFDMPKSLRLILQGAGKIDIWQGGKGYMFKEDKLLIAIQFNAELSTRTELGYIQTYMSKHKAIADNKDYIFIRYAASDYFQVVDETDALKDYARGWLKKGNIDWDNSEPGTNYLTFTFYVVWD